MPSLPSPLVVKLKLNLVLDFLSFSHYGLPNIRYEHCDCCQRHNHLRYPKSCLATSFNMSMIHLSSPPLQELYISRNEINTPAVPLLRLPRNDRSHHRRSGRQSGQDAGIPTGCSNMRSGRCYDPSRNRKDERPYRPL